ncbi:hypothetical protein VOLCADRAFT_118912, partial [Volvox carteri f. nagariensis]
MDLHEISACAHIRSAEDKRALWDGMKKKCRLEARKEDCNAVPTMVMASGSDSTIAAHTCTDRQAAAATSSAAAVVALAASATAPAAPAAPGPVTPAGVAGDGSSTSGGGVSSSVTPPCGDPVVTKQQILTTGPVAEVAAARGPAGAIEHHQPGQRAVITAATTVTVLRSVTDLELAVAHLRARDPRSSRGGSSGGPWDCGDGRGGGASHSLFAALARSVVYQQLATKAASAIWGRVLAVCKATSGDLLTPGQVLSTPAEQLRAAGLSGRKLEYLTGMAEAFATREGWEERLAATHDLDQLVSELTSLRGVGSWTVHMLAMFHLGLPDVLPCGDLGVRRGLQQLHKLPKLPQPKQVEDLTEAWRPY